MAVTIASANVAGVLAEAWEAFREAARDDSGGWDPTSAAAEVRPEGPLPCSVLFRHTPQQRQTTRTNERWNRWPEHIPAGDEEEVEDSRLWQYPLLVGLAVAGVDFQLSAISSLMLGDIQAFARLQIYQGTLPGVPLLAARARAGP